MRRCPDDLLNHRLAGESRPPNLFGNFDRMGILMSLARYGPHRRIDVVSGFGRYSIDNLEVGDKAGLMIRWRLPRAHRGWGLALNPAFPLLPELKSLLCELDRVFPSPYRSTCATAERKASVSNKWRGDLELLFTSRVRTATLLTIETLSEPDIKTLKRCVPGHSIVSVKNVLRFLTEQRVVVSDRGRIRFRSESWILKLRTLLRALGKAHPEWQAQILSKLDKTGRPVHAQTDHRTALFGTFTLQRTLAALAQKPRRYNELFGIVNADPSGGLRLYEKMGIVVSKKIGTARHYSLNRAHPAYTAIRNLLLAISDEPRTKHTNDFEEQTTCRPDLLFAEALRTSVLLTIEALNDHVTGFTLARLLPQHHRTAIYSALKHFRKLGILVARGRGIAVLYSFNPECAYYRELKVVLHRTNDVWPYWRHGAAAASYLQSENRRPKKKIAHARHNVP
jgi:hypothetical protein